MDELFGLPESTVIDGTLYCHASPRSDMETFLPRPGERDEELLARRRGARGSWPGTSTSRSGGPAPAASSS